MLSDGGEATMFRHEFRGNGEISWDDGTEFVATTRVRRPVVVSNRSHAVIFLPITPCSLASVACFHERTGKRTAQKRHGRQVRWFRWF
jgi:hypothetical protein